MRVCASLSVENRAPAPYLLRGRLSHYGAAGLFSCLFFTRRFSCGFLTHFKSSQSFALIALGLLRQQQGMISAAISVVKQIRDGELTAEDADMGKF